MKIIIVGCGKVGQKLTEKLSQEKEHDITVVDLSRKVVENLINQYDVMGVVGNCSELETLKEAGIDEADLLIAVTGADELNLLTCLISKKAGGCNTIARVRKPEYRASINLLKDDLGLEMIINPEFAAAQEIARVLRFPSAVQIDTFAKGRVEILKFKLPAGSVLDNMPIMQMSQKVSSDILVCGVERGDETFIPGGNFILKSGDFISIVAPVGTAGQFFKKINIKTNRVKDAVIVGGGEIGYYLARRLLATGIKVKIVEIDEARCNELCELLPKATIINGDGTDNRTLLEEGLEYADSFIALTNIDEENIMLSLFAKSKIKGKIVTKINRIAYDEVISELGLDTTVYPKDLAAEYIVEYVRAKNNSIGSNIETMHNILDGKAEALEFRIRENSPVVGIPIEQLKIKNNILIACIISDGKIIIPRGRDVISKGDTVIIVTTHFGFEDILDILE